MVVGGSVNLARGFPPGQHVGLWVERGVGLGVFGKRRGLSGGARSRVPGLDWGRRVKFGPEYRRGESCMCMCVCVGRGVGGGGVLVLADWGQVGCGTGLKTYSAVHSHCLSSG